MDFTVVLSTVMVTLYVPLLNLIAKLAIPLVSVVLLYVIPLMVIFTVLFAIGLFLESYIFTIKLSGPP